MANQLREWVHRPASQEHELLRLEDRCVDIRPAAVDWEWLAGWHEILRHRLVRVVRILIEPNAVSCR